MSDIVTRLWGNTGDKYPGFQNLNTEAAAEITRLRDELAAWKAEAEAARSERAAFFSKTMNYEDWQAASKRVQDARAAADAIEKENP